MSHLYILRETPEYVIKGEKLWFGMILHVDVLVPWAKGVRSRLKSDIQKTVLGLPMQVFAFQTEDCDPKKRKFIHDMGFVYNHNRKTGDGKWAEMFVLD